MTVHDSPHSESSSATSPYVAQHRTGHHASILDTKGNLEDHRSGNPRTIIVPPLKTQASEVLVECDSLGPGKQSGPSSCSSDPLQTSGCAPPPSTIHCDLQGQGQRGAPPSQSLAEAAITWGRNRAASPTPRQNEGERTPAWLSPDSPPLDFLDVWGPLACC